MSLTPLTKQIEDHIEEGNLLPAQEILALRMLRRHYEVGHSMMDISEAEKATGLQHPNRPMWVKGGQRLLASQRPVSQEIHQK
jgi:hypothetical protein